MKIRGSDAVEIICHSETERENEEEEEKCLTKTKRET